MENTLDSILATVNAFFPNGAALHEPSFCGNEWIYTKECLDTGWVSSVGKFVDRFEHDLAAFTGARFAVACVNGTAALHASLLLAGVGSGDEVILPALTFVATANAVAYCGAIPHFVDSEHASLGIDPEALGRHLSGIVKAGPGGKPVNRLTGRRISAMVLMHALGHPAQIEALGRICSHYGIPMVEDAAESLGSYQGGRHTGTFGLLATLSFNGNKVVTTGGGGAILTNDESVAKRAKHLTTTAKLPHAWAFVHDEVGFNYRLPNLNAALGCAQLESLPLKLEKKRRIARRYEEAFSGRKGVRFLKEPEGTRSNYWLNAIVLDSGAAGIRDSVLSELNHRKIQVRPLWTLMHRLPSFQHAPRADLRQAEDLELRVICLPSSPQLCDQWSVGHA